MKILTSDPQRCHEWIERKLALKLPDLACAYGILDNKGQDIIAAVSFTRWTGRECYIQLAGRAALSRFGLRISAEIAFNQLGCHRLSAMTKLFSPMYYLMPRLGFEWEGRLREYYQDGSDATIWGMLRGECRWF